MSSVSGQLRGTVGPEAEAYCKPLSQPSGDREKATFIVESARECFTKNTRALQERKQAQVPGRDNTVREIQISSILKQAISRERS